MQQQPSQQLELEELKKQLARAQAGPPAAAAHLAPCVLPPIEQVMSSSVPSLGPSNLQQQMAALRQWGMMQQMAAQHQLPQQQQPQNYNALALMPPVQQQPVLQPFQGPPTGGAQSPSVMIPQPPPGSL